MYFLVGIALGTDHPCPIQCLHERINALTPGWHRNTKSPLDFLVAGCRV
jgi:hypothetical protein